MNQNLFFLNKLKEKQMLPSSLGFWLPQQLLLLFLIFAEKVLYLTASVPLIFYLSYLSIGVRKLYNILNTAMLTGKMVSVPVKTLAVDTNGTVTDVTNYTNCRSTEVDVLKVSERCNYVFVNGKETKGKSSVMLNFTYGFLSAQLEMSVWMPRLPMLIDIADPELSQIKGWRVPVTTGNRRSTWDSEEDEDMRKGRGCMLQYQLSAVRVLTPFVAQPDSGVLPGPFTGEEPVDVTNLVRYSLKVADPDVARVQDGLALQGRAVGTTIVQVLSPLTSSVLAERTIRVVDDKVTVTELGVQLVSGLSLSLQLSPGSNRAIVATATTRETITELKQEAVVSCWVQFSDGAVAPLELFDRGVYSLTVSTNDERVATVRRTPLSTFVVAQGEGEGRGRQVRVELRICEECQKSKRKSKLAVGAAILKTNFQSGRGGANKNVEAAGEVKTAVTSQKIATSDLIRTFKALSDLEIGMYSLIGVSCIAIVAFLLNCASHKLCFRKQKTPVQKGPAPTADPKDHKHDWVWMGGNNHSTPPPGAPAAPAQASTSSSQQHQFQAKPIDPMANRSATLLARPHRSEPLHSPTSKRNQVQFTTFTTLDIKHLAALKKNGVDLNWANQKAQQPPAQPQTPLPDMPWPVVTPLGEPQ
uniref:Si:dkey-1d7.3 n=1 Tax=Fundulus heteroclitus TaxID=8078 RepID=A0A3Q2T2I5_FUNHE